MRTLIAETETIFRFAHPEKLIGYAGLAQRVKQRAAMDRRGGANQARLRVVADGID